jgi:thiol-disulfide isomerase/thioredoxin/predicted negative regulator of RcsB-dependent stress response
MRMRMVVALVLGLVATESLICAQGAAGQAPGGSSTNNSTTKGSSDSAPSGPRPQFASVSDPACPVADGVAPQPITKELRVLYLPMARQAAISDPKALVLHIAFDDGSFRDDVRTAAFAKREDGAWEAPLPLHSQNRYAIYWVEEPGTKRVDTNGGAYFEVLFCDARGERPESTIGYRARTYDGWLESHGFDRPANFSKALEILGGYIHPPERGGSLFFWWWYFKDLQGKRTAQTRSALLAEMRQFVREHEADQFGYSGTFDFAEFANWVPLELGEQLADALQKDYSAEWDPHVDLLVSRASHEKDEAKRFSELREIIARYPENIHADDARMTLFLDSKDLGEREKLYALLSTKRHSEVSLRLQMAQAYLDAGTRYGIALAVLDDAEKICDERLKDQGANDYARRYAQDEKGAVAVMRADVLIRTGKAKEAVAILMPRKGEFKRGHSFYVLGTALEKTGKRREAVDSYLSATVIVGPDQKKANDAVERLWVKSGMGTKEELRGRVEQESVKAFETAAYEPKLVSREAPELDLTTTSGEHFTSTGLRGKSLVLNFWATWCGSCVFELKGLEDFQAKHPETVVLTVVEDDTEQKDLDAVLKERRVAALRVSKVAVRVFDEYGAVGVPHTFVIDESGKVRVHHFGGMEDAVRELEKDLEAIREEKQGSSE